MAILSSCYLPDFPLCNQDLIVIGLYEQSRPPDGPLFFNPFHFTQQINVRVTISRKIHFMQRIVHLFGPEVLGQVLRSPNPVILPLILYENSFDVAIFILL